MFGTLIAGLANKALDKERPRNRPPKPYMLEVTLNVGLSSVAAYFDQAADVRTDIEGKTPLRMKVAATSMTGTQLLHIWSVPNADDLRQGMIALADDSAYARLDRLITRETQDFSTSLGMVPANQPSGRGGQYLQMSGYLASKDLAEFQAIYEAYPPTLKPRGLDFWGCFLNVSGRVNRIMSLWVLSQGTVTPDALKNLPGLKMLKHARVSQWLATPYHP